MILGSFGVRASAIAVGAALLFAGCSEGPAATGPAAPAREALAARAVTTASGDVCTGTGAHDKHTGMGLSCETCHACGGVYAFTDLTFAGGTTTAGGTINKGDPTTCSVGCHYPFGAPQTTIAWTAGTLGCTSCHTNVASVGVTYNSAHARANADVEIERSGCLGCHVLDQHTSGKIKIAVDGEGTVTIEPGVPGQLDAACQACHDRSGTVIDGSTPPVLVGWSSPTGDFHGSRVGAGYGGTLLPPYQVGQGAIACDVCHDAHASVQPYLFRATVNGAVVGPAVVTGAGVGGEALCEACHAGNRHQGCIDCHGVDPQPAGSPCFLCHGHEGVVNFPPPIGSHQEVASQTDPQCRHCHGVWYKPLEYDPPVISGLTLANVTPTSASILWSTDEEATSWIEWGIDTPNRVAGNAIMATSHSVALTGLAELTRYTYRVRTADALRNVRLSDLRTFVTGSASAPPAPKLTELSWMWACDPGVPVSLAWSAVTSPKGNPVQYRMVYDDSADFSSPIIDTGWITNRSVTTNVVGASPPATFYWRVMARDSVTLSPSSWSTVDTFEAFQDETCWW